MRERFINDDKDKSYFTTIYIYVKPRRLDISIFYSLNHMERQGWLGVLEWNKQFYFYDYTFNFWCRCEKILLIRFAN